jgi:hypothetical protein
MLVEQELLDKEIMELLGLGQQVAVAAAHLL